MKCKLLSFFIKFNIKLRTRKATNFKLQHSRTLLQCLHYFSSIRLVINIDLTVPNVSCTHVSCTPSTCLPITIVSSLNTQAASRLYLQIKTYIQYYICLELFYGVRSSRNMSKHYVDHLDKLLVKSMDFCEFFDNFN